MKRPALRSLLGGVAWSLAWIMSLPAQAQTRTTVVTYLSWYLPFGTTVGCDQWREGGLGYRRSRAAGVNHPTSAAVASTRLGPIDFAQSPEGQRAIRADLIALRDAGFDVLAFDMLPSPNPKRPAVDGAAYCGMDLFERFGDIAGSLGLKAALFSDIKNLSADHPQGYTLSESEWAQAYATVHDRYGQRDWYWRPRGLPVVWQFGATEGAMKGATGLSALTAWQRVGDALAQGGKAIDMALDVRPKDLPLPAAARAASSTGPWWPFVFAPAAPVGFMNDFQAQVAAASPYPAWSVSPGYYSRRLAVHVPPGFMRIDAAYQAAIRNKAQVLMFNTWNDFEEDTDAMPSAAKGTALLEVLKYYNAWFKTGAAPVLKSPTLVLAAPVYRFDETRTAPPSWGHGALEAEPEGAGRVVYFWSASPSGGWIEFNGQRVALPRGVGIGRHVVGEAASVEVRTSFGATARLPIIRSSAGESAHDDQPGRSFRYTVLKKG